MNRLTRYGLVPSLLLAVGVLASTIVASQLSDSWLTLVGAVIMAVTLIGAGAMIPQSEGVRRKAMQSAIILGAALLLASVIVVSRDPALLATLMPILAGGVAAATVLTVPCKGATSRPQ